ncbi:hypothetical protein RKE30_34765 [Streptomyces sp. Li-HN-5-11]|uniref:hypothetical protein n=1 Tax=Streptomyces sp. Li-HN-5-11 TaxID=3075432 RepID=UPI0028A7E5EC|nr:hypothetical protein [Streptomyces sp. Li-HN-5-11]WNM35164.1 hypothetical protein RKE30_34765 [Streptomyces sp. Li-HN-5-11]
MAATPEGYDGMDPLTAALTDEPLPPGARADSAFMAEYRAAAADVSVLRKQLLVLGEALAEAPPPPPPADAAPVGRSPVGGPRPVTGPNPVSHPPRGEESHTSPQGPCRPASGTPGSGTPRSGEPGSSGAGACSSGGARPPGSRGPGPRPSASRASAPHGSAPGRPAPRPPRARKPRARALVLGALAAAVAVSAAVGLGRLATQGGGVVSDTSAEKAGSAASRARPSGAGTAQYLACARLVAEGTVLAVTPAPGGNADSVTLRVTRSYRPDHSRAEVRFLLGPGTEPRPRAGDHVLVGMPRAGASPDLWAVGDAEVARGRAWIVKALPESRTLTCDGP